jgi:hypothetical protein
VGCATGRSEERAARDEAVGDGGMAAANAGCGGLTTTWRYEVCDGRASRNVFLREMEETYK